MNFLRQWARAHATNWRIQYILVLREWNCRYVFVCLVAEIGVQTADTDDENDTKYINFKILNNSSMHLKRKRWARAGRFSVQCSWTRMDRQRTSGRTCSSWNSPFASSGCAHEYILQNLYLNFMQLKWIRFLVRRSILSDLPPEQQLSQAITRHFYLKISNHRKMFSRILLTKCSSKMISKFDNVECWMRSEDWRRLKNHKISLQRWEWLPWPLLRSIERKMVSCIQHTYDVLHIYLGLESIVRDSDVCVDDAAVRLPNWCSHGVVAAAAACHFY